MQVDLVHRHHLRVPAARRAALHPEAWPKAGLPQADGGALADAGQRVAEAHGGRRLALTGGGRADSGHQHERAVWPAFLPGNEVETYLRLVPAIGLHRILGDRELGGDLGDGTKLGGKGDLKVWIHLRRLPCALYQGH